MRTGLSNSSPANILRHQGCSSGLRAGMLKSVRFHSWPRSLLKENIVYLPASFVLNSCRNKPHQRCQGLAKTFRFKAKFLTATSLSSSGNPNAPLGSCKVTAFSYQAFLLQSKLMGSLRLGSAASSLARLCSQARAFRLLDSGGFQPLVSPEKDHFVEMTFKPILKLNSKVLK